MIEFTVTTADIKTALSVVSLATHKIQNTLRSHALFEILKDEISLMATDEDKIALSHSFLENISGETGKFTLDPKRLQTLITNSDTDRIRISYSPDTNTVNVYASDNKKAFVSFPSFKPEEFLTFNLSEQDKHGMVNSEVLLKGFRFIQGFLPRDDKNKSYACLFFDGGALYGSNGYNKIAVFQNTGLEAIPELAIRREMIPAVINIIEKTKVNEISVESSKKYITFSSPDSRFCFGFRKSIISKPKFPISLEIPETDGFNIDRAALIKKLSRLSLSSYEDFVIKMTYGEDSILKMDTMTGRTSYEEIPCERLSGNNSREFFMECTRFKNALDLFQATDVDLYIQEKRCIIYSKADIVMDIDKKETVIPIVSVAHMFLSRKV